MSSVHFNPATRIGTTPQAQPARRAEPQSLEERQLIARLFGKPIPDMNSSQTTTAAVSTGNDNDEYAPNLGRHLDILA
ncbi:MAG: hypothetical protein Kow0074_05790 [Candidatus Zixiibacteriota bacterium]